MKIDQLIRTRRKSIALIIERDGRLIVRAPLHATQRQIAALLEKKTAWIERKQAEVKAAYPPVPPKEYVSGESFLFLGQSYRLSVADGDALRALQLTEDGFLLPTKALPRAQAVFRAWYREQAYRVFSERAAAYAAKLGFSYQRVKITSAQTRWGSCSSKGALSFTWRLVMAPLPVIDYVVIHELVHTQERNHGKGFWDKVGMILPDFQKRKDWLDANGRLLTL